MATSSAPLVSVLMPVRNGRDFIADAVRSVLRQQVSLELIVVDDGSTDGSAEIVRSLNDDRVRVVEGPRSGAAAATNVALESAAGRFIALCDADDLYPADRLQWQTQWLDSHGEFAAVSGSFSAVTEGGSAVTTFSCGSDEEEITAELRRGTTRTSLCSFLIRIEALLKIGGFRPYFLSAYDIDLQLRLGESARVFYVPREAYLWRLHDSSLTHTLRSSVRDFYERTAHAFQVQRASRGTDDLQRGMPPLPPAQQSPPTAAADHVAQLFIGEAWKQHRAGDRIEALRCGLRAVGAAPFRLSPWKTMVALLLKGRDPSRDR